MNSDMTKKPAPVRLVGPGPHTHCSRCGQQIHWITTEKGKKMPCEVELTEGDGRMNLIDQRGVMHAKAKPGTWGYEPHIAYCGKKTEQEQRNCRRGL